MRRGTLKENEIGKTVRYRRRRERVGLKVLMDLEEVMNGEMRESTSRGLQ